MATHSKEFFKANPTVARANAIFSNAIVNGEFRRSFRMYDIRISLAQRDGDMRAMKELIARRRRLFTLIAGELEERRLDAVSDD